MDIKPKNIVVEAKPYKLLTYSNMSMFLDCPMKYYFRNVLKIVPMEKSKALTIGSTFHDAIDMYFKKPNPKEVDRFIIDECKKNANYLESNDDVMIQGMVKGFIAKFENAPIKIVNTEQLFDFEFNKEFHCCGKIDAELVNDKGQTFFGEWKSASQIETYVKIMQTSNQHNHYLWAMESHKPIGIIYRIARKSMLRLKKGETIEAFRDRILEDYTNRPEENFHEEIIWLDKVKLARWKHEVGQIAERISDFCKQNSWYRNTGACWNHHTLCPYHKVCEAVNAKDREDTIKVHYLFREPGEELFEIKE